MSHLIQPRKVTTMTTDERAELGRLMADILRGGGVLPDQGVRAGQRNIEADEGTDCRGDRPDPPEARDADAQPEPLPEKVTGRDGKKYPATRPTKPASEPEPEPTARASAAGSELLERLAELASIIEPDNWNANIGDGELWEISTRLDVIGRLAVRRGMDLRRRLRM